MKIGGCNFYFNIRIFNKIYYENYDVLDRAKRILYETVVALLPAEYFIQFNLLYSIKLDPFRYLKSMEKICRVLRQEFETTYVVYPIWNKSSYVMFDTFSIARCILGRNDFSDFNTLATRTEVWGTVFDLDSKLFRMVQNGHGFNGTFETDGEGVSILSGDQNLRPDVVRNLSFEGMNRFRRLAGQDKLDYLINLSNIYDAGRMDTRSKRFYYTHVRKTVSCFFNCCRSSTEVFFDLWGPNFSTLEINRNCKSLKRNNPQFCRN